MIHLHFFSETAHTVSKFSIRVRVQEWVRLGLFLHGREDHGVFEKEEEYTHALPVVVLDY